MFRKKRLQVVDLGAHVIKALVLEPAPDGRLVPVAAEARPLPDPVADPDRHLQEVERCLASLARGPLVRGEPVHVLGPESLVRGAIASLSGVPEGSLPDVVGTDRARFLRTFGTRQKTFASSVRLKVGRAGEVLDVTLAHAYARWVDLEHLHHQLRAHGLELGSVLPRALAMRELARRVLPAAPGHVIVAEVGFSATSLMRITDGEARAWKVVFAGGADLFRDVAGQMQRDAPLDGATALAVLRSAGFTGDERAPASAGLTDVEARGAARALKERAGPLFDAIARGCESLLAEPGGEGDGAPCRVLFAGGIAALPGFIEAARQRLPAASRRIADCDPLPIADALDAPLPAGAPAELFAACVGAARLAGTPDATAGDVAREYVQLISKQDAAASRWSPWNPRLARAMAGTVAALVAGTALWANALGNRMEELTTAIASERAGLESPATMKDLLARYRDVRAREALADTRVRYAALLASHRPEWPAIVDRIGALALPKSVVLTELTFDVRWPRSADPSDSDAKHVSAEGKVLEVKLAGEADSLDTLRKFVGELETQKVLTEIAYDSSARTPEGKAHGLEHHAHFAFSVTGLGEISKNAE